MKLYKVIPFCIAFLALSGCGIIGESHTADSAHRTTAVAGAQASGTAPTAGQRAEMARLLDDVDRLQADSPTPEGAIKARRLRDRIERLQADRTLSVEERNRRIEDAEASIARAREDLGLTPR